MALGRGLESLFPNKIDNDNTDQLVLLDLNKIKPNPNQPRKEFSPEKLEELSLSIKKHGIIEPIIVKQVDDTYTIVAGERRWRAANLIGLENIPAIIKNTENSLEISIIENLQREDLNIIELAQGYQYLIDNYNYTHEDLANSLGVNRSSVSNVLRILKLPEEIINFVRNDELSYGQARALLSIEDPELQNKIAKEIKNKKMSVREVEKLVKSKINKPKKNDQEESDSELFLETISNWLTEHYDTKVKIKLNKNKGNIQFNYNSLKQLQSLLNSFGYKEKIL